MTQRSRIKMTIAILLMMMVVTLFTSPLSANGNGTGTYQFLPGPNYTQGDIKALLKISGDDNGLPPTSVEWKDPQGKTVACHPTGGGCTTYNEYYPNGSLKSATHEFFISGQQRSSGTYKAVATYCHLDPVMHRCTGYWTELFQAEFYINVASITHTLSGNAGVADATLSYVEGTTKTAAADGAGNYMIPVPSGWSGTVTPSKPGFIFSPGSRMYTDVLADQTAQNFTATAMPYRICLPLVIH